MYSKEEPVGVSNLMRNLPSSTMGKNSFLVALNSWKPMKTLMSERAITMALWSRDHLKSLSKKASKLWYALVKGFEGSSPFTSLETAIGVKLTATR